MGLNRSNQDSAVFYKESNGKTQLIIFVHVDDITVAGETIKIINWFKTVISKEVQFTDGNEIHWLLGIEIKRDRIKRTIMLRQKNYIEKILK